MIREKPNSVLTIALKTITQQAQTETMPLIKPITTALAIVALIAVAACSTGPSQDDINSAEATAAASIQRIAELEALIENADSASTDSAQPAPTMPSGGQRLQDVRDRDEVICASRNNVPGFGSLDEAGRNIGFDIDLCRALAAAVLGDAEKIKIQYITAAEHGPTIQSGDVDLLARTVTLTTSREASWGNGTITMFYDGQGFIVPKSLNVTSAFELDGAAVCVASGTTTEQNMADFFRQNNFALEANTYEDLDVVRDSYAQGLCDAMTNDHSALAALRATLTDPDEHIILPEFISEEPLTPIVPHGDEQWFDIVKTVMSGLIYAEAYGIDSGNVDQVASGNDAKSKRLLGTEGSFGQETLGLAPTFMKDVIEQVGNYGEIYDRNLGPSTIDLPRTGRNRLWTNGGQIYGPPLR